MVHQLFLISLANKADYRIYEITYSVLNRWRKCREGRGVRTLKDYSNYSWMCETLKEYLH